MTQNSLEVEYPFTERNKQLYLVPLFFSLALCLNSKELSISFLVFERQLFKRIGPLTNTAKCVVIRNVPGTEKFIKEKLLRLAWHDTLNSFRKVWGVFLFFILCIN